MKLWQGRFSKEASPLTNDFNSSIQVDSRMFREDIQGSKAHANMLSMQGIITAQDNDAIQAGLDGILDDILSGALPIDPDAEDIHTFIEQTLTERIGAPGKRLHTGRSRNDQVATDIRLYLRGECAEVLRLIDELSAVLHAKGVANKSAILPGYTHLQRAQPISFDVHLLAYEEMLKRDSERITQAAARMNVSPLGSGALAGTGYPIDRQMTAEALGFDGYTASTLDGVADRDFCVELASDLSLLMVHLSRLSEEIILWASSEFRFVELDDAYATGSSIMPQKKNPDLAELIRGKSGRVFGDTVALLTILKGLPLAYNKDMQEDKEAVFDAFDTAKLCLKTMAPMIATMRTMPSNMRKAAAKGFINATDAADYLVGKGLPFRDAYKAVGTLVAICIREYETLESLPLEKYKEVCPLFDTDVYPFIALEACVARRRHDKERVDA
ncbi:MAG: argininosuccinate lyase [Oscillospiraceae bacterium]|jgi:argininosuccinate lyase|nr:argininosuccinate lyase [Oscillospiraceae bacterium]